MTTASPPFPSDSLLDWSEDEIDAHYTMGHCHVMALALSQATELPLGVMWSGLDWHIEPDEDGLGGIKEIVHIFVDCGDGDILDVRGKRPLDDMRREFAPHEWMICPCGPLHESLLSDLVHQSRSLVPFDDAEIAEALAVVERIPAVADAISGLTAARVSRP